MIRRRKNLADRSARSRHDGPGWCQFVTAGLLRETPGFTALKAEVEGDLAAQFARMHEWEAGGELVPMPSR